MRKSTKRFLAILVSMLLCASLAVTIILACPFDPECDGPDECHMYETDDGPVSHHHGPFINTHETFEIGSGDPDFCPGTYYYISVYCEACGSNVTQGDNFQFHDCVLHSTNPNDKNTWYWECELCGYTYDYVE